MSSGGSERPEYSNLRNLLDQTCEIDFVTSATRPELGSINFSDVVPVLEQCTKILKAFAEIDLGILPIDQTNEIYQILMRFQESFVRLSNFNLVQTNPVAARDALQNEIRARYREMFGSFSGAIGVWSALKLNLPALKSEIRTDVDQSIEKRFEQHQAALSNIDSASKQASEALHAIQTAAGQAGVSTHATIFANQAHEHLVSSRIWLGSTLIALFGVVAWGAFAVHSFPSSSNLPLASVVQDAIARLIVFSGLSYALLWSARNYSANRHNYVLNKHRQNSLSTFTAFASAAEEDKDTKNAVLIQATTSIFAAQKTGYSTREPDVSQPSQILEIVRAVKGD